MLWPESCAGSKGNCCAAPSARANTPTAIQPPATAGHSLRMFVGLLPGANACHCWLRFVLRGPFVVVGVADVGDVHPGVRHFVHRTVAESHPLLRIGIVRVRARVIVPCGYV